VQAGEAGAAAKEPQRGRKAAAAHAEEWGAQVD
jgi:hypothetical protein